MGDTNYIGSVVKILEKPIQTVINDKIVRTQFRVQLVQVRNTQIADLALKRCVHQYQPYTTSISNPNL